MPAGHRDVPGKVVDRLSAPAFLGLSTGRAGSRYLTGLLNAAGIRTIHEKTYDPPQWNGGGALGEVSAHLVVPVCEKGAWPEARVWHFTRHPQPFVTSLIAFGFWRMNARWIHPYLRRTGDLIVDSYRYWLGWNARILSVPAERRTTFRIEGFDTRILSSLANEIDCSLPAELPEIRWDERQRFAPIPDSIAASVEKMMETLGYA